MNTIPAASLSPRNPTTKSMNSSLINTEENRKAKILLPAFPFAGFRFQVSAFLFAFALLAFLAAPAAHAATQTWNGTTSGNMSGTASNWNSAVPTGTDIAYFNLASYTPAPTANANMSFGELWFGANSGALTFSTGANTLTLNGTSGIGIQMDNGSGAVSTGSAKFALGAAQSWINNSASNTLTVGGTINAGGFLLTLNGTGATSLGGVISSAGGALSISNGTVTLGGNNTFTGGITLNSGTLKLGSSTTGSLGVGGALTINGGTVDVTGARTTPGNNTQTWNADWTYGGSSTWNTGTGAVTLNATSIALTNSGASALTVGGTATGTSNLTLKVNAGGAITLADINNTGTITNSGTGTAATTLTNVGTNVTGITQASNTSALVITNALTGLGGTNTFNISKSNIAITGSANLTLTGGVNNIGTITNDNTGTGTLTIGAIGTNVTNVTQNSATSTMNLNGVSTTYNNANGYNITLGTLKVSDASVFTAGTKFTLASGGRLDVNVANQSLAKLNVGTGNVVVAGSFLRYSQVQTTGGTGPGTISGTVELNITNVNPNYTLDFAAGGKLTNVSASSVIYTSGITLSGNATIDSANQRFDGTGMTVSASTAGAKTLTLTGSYIGSPASTITGIISDGSGTINIEKTGTGTWTLGNNTFTGSVTVTDGTLNLNTAVALNVANVVTVGGSGTAPILDITVSNTIAGLNDGGFTNGTVTNSSAVVNRTLTLGGSGTYSFGGTITATIPVNLALTKSGTGTQTLAGTNTYTGTTTVSGGTLEIKSGASALAQTLGVLTLAGADVTLKSNKSGAAALSTTFATLTARTTGNTANIVSSGGTPGTDNSIILTRAAGFIDKGVYFNGADFASMNAINTYVRALAYGTDPNAAAVDTILSGNHTKLTSTPGSQNTISLLSLNLSGSGVSWTNNASQTLTVPGIIKSGGGTQSTISGGNLTGGSNTELVIRTDTAADLLAISSNLTQGSGVLTKSGAGTLTLSGTNTFTGQTYVNGGTLSIGANVNLGAQATGAILNLRGGTLQATNTFGLYNGSAGTSNRAVVLTNAAGFDVTSTNTLTVAGVVSGSGSLTKSGTGTQILSGTNTYTGATTVSQGTLLINGNSSAATGTISVSNGAILGGAGTAGAAVISAGTLSPGDGTTAIGAFTATALTLNTGANFKFDLGGSNTSDRIVLAGAFTRGTGTSFSVNFNNTGVADSTYILATFASLAGGFTAGDVSNFTYTGLAGGVTSGTFGLTGTDLTFTTVPEPQTWALLAFSLTVVTVLRRRRNS